MGLSIVIVIVIILVYRYMIFSEMINGTWIATDAFKNESEISEMIVVIGGGMKKNINIVIKTSETVADSGTIIVFPELSLCVSKSVMRCKISIDTMKDANIIKVNSDGSLVIEGKDSVYFDGLKL